MGDPEHALSVDGHAVGPADTVGESDDGPPLAQRALFFVEVEGGDMHGWCVDVSTWFRRQGSNQARWTSSHRRKGAGSCRPVRGHRSCRPASA